MTYIALGFALSHAPLLIITNAFCFPWMAALSFFVFLAKNSQQCCSTFHYNCANIGCRRNIAHGRDQLHSPTYFYKKLGFQLD